MSELLWNNKRLAKELGMSVATARKFCIDNGVLPLKSSPTSRKPRLLWIVKDVIQMVDTLRVQPEPDDIVPPKYGEPRILGCTPKELVERFKKEPPYGNQEKTG